MIKMTFRKIILLLYHASILIYVDIYLNIISACEIVLILRRDLAMCSTAI